jgi:hypothetical protein
MDSGFCVNAGTGEYYEHINLVYERYIRSGLADQLLPYRLRVLS